MTTTRSEPWTEAFGALLTEAIERSPLNRREIAARAELTDTALRGIEAGRSGGKPYGGKPTTVAKLARVLGITPAQLRRAGHPLAAEAYMLTGVVDPRRRKRQVDQLGRLTEIVDEMRTIVDSLRIEHGE